MKRSPLCGRNFEYYSEDPYLAGQMATSYINSMQDCGVGTSLKHFACNNQETHRMTSNSMVDERALREIYLKAFEMVVKEGVADSFMTTYGSLNGTWTSSCYDLNTTILREQWGFKGLVMTDWWTSGEHYLEAKAGNDLKMGNGYPDRVKFAYDRCEITHDHLYAAAKHVLELILKME